MELTIDPKALFYLGSVPIIIGLVQLFKIWVTDTRYYPVIAVLCSFVINLFTGWMINVTWAVSLLAGLIAGLAASGLYSIGSTVKEGDQADKANRQAATPPAGANQ